MMLGQNQQEPNVKMMDKASFTLGVVSICVLEWVALRHGSWFPLYYASIMTFLLTFRLFYYTQQKYQLFMLGRYSLDEQHM